MLSGAPASLFTYMDNRIVSGLYAYAGQLQSGGWSDPSDDAYHPKASGSATRAAGQSDYRNPPAKASRRDWAVPPKEHQQLRREEIEERKGLWTTLLSCMDFHAASRWSIAKGE